MGKVEYRVKGDSAIGTLLFKGMCVEFVIDAADLSGVKAHKWHYASNAYIATSVTVAATKTAAMACAALSQHIEIGAHSIGFAVN
jgi:hypothetical protein